MEKRSILHMLDPTPHNSPFDINMAVDAGFDMVFPYNNVKTDDVNGLVQDAIFSRGPAGVKQTAVFIGGRDMRMAMDMLNIAKKAMVPPFEVSVFADPSGSYTTAAALVACVEKQLKEKHGKELKGMKAVVFGGTGPVGIATGILADMSGAETTLVDHLSIDTSLSVCNEYNGVFGTNLQATCASSEADKAHLLSDADIVFCTAKAGIRVLSASVLKDAGKLLVAGDVNAVPPLGIEGFELMDMGVPVKHASNAPGAVGVGALAVGDVKYKLQHKLLQIMLETDKPVYLDFRKAFEIARELV